MKKFKKPMTLEKLAQMVQLGFDEISHRFNDIYSQVEGVRNELRREINRLDIRITRLQETVDEIRLDLNSHHKRLCVLENKARRA